MRYQWIIVLCVAGCASSDAPPECRDIACDLEPDRDSLLAALAGHEDPIAATLRSEVSSDGTTGGDFKMLLAAVGTRLPCQNPASFLVLSNQNLIPKPVLTHCADDPQMASQFFLALPSLNADETDVESQLIHMAAWDESNQRYRHYAAHPAEDGTMRFSVEPGFCMRCHGGPTGLTTWQPLMNEMTNPWSQWIASPGFASQLFDEHLDETVAEGQLYQVLSRAPNIHSAQALQAIIESGIDRFAGARLRVHTAPADLAATRDLVRPLFCDETINYASEVHESGQIRTAVLVDRGTQAMLRRLFPTAAFSWSNDTLQLAPPAAGESPLTFVPIRGRSTEEMELGLVARGVLSERQVLRIRALDWTHPVGSEFRCKLFRKKLESIHALDDGMADNGAAARWLVERVLADHQPATGTDLVALSTPGARPENLSARAFADRLDAHVRAAVQGPRAHLQAERKRRLCQQRALPTAPLLPELRCP